MNNTPISIKFSLSALAVTAVLTLAHSAIAAEEIYKTTAGHVVVTGLTPTQRYQIRTLSVQNKSSSRQDKSVNSCGEIVIEKAANYKTLVVGIINIDPATLPTKTFVRCKPAARRGATMSPSGVVRATSP